MVRYQDINIIYEDNHLLVVEKPKNVPVCEDSSLDDDLLNILKMYIKEKYNKPGNVYLGLVHRLDRPVGGVMVFAKTSKAASRLSEQVRSHKLTKVYYAVCFNKIKKSSGIFEDYMVKDSKRNISYVTNEKCGKKAVLRYDVLGYKNNMSLVKIFLETGRSHQIRVQFSSRGYPLVGDKKYNSKISCDIALFASELSFYHPISGNEVKFKLKIPNRYPFNLF